MNDRRFIELLNLYVDQELSDDDARELEHEIAHRPERRRVYTEYCRMQRACVRLFEQQTAPRPEIDRLAAAALAPHAEPAPLEVLTLPSEPVVRRARRSPAATWLGWGSGLVAAAACIALVVQRQTPASSQIATTTGETAAPVEARLAAAPAAPEQPAVEAATSGSAYRPVLVVNTLLRPAAGQPAQPAASLAFEQPSLEWLQELKLGPMRRVPLEALQFDPQGGLRGTDTPTFVNGPAEYPVATELTAFQFQR